MSPRCAAHSEPLARRNLIDAKARIRVIEPLELVMQVADAAAAENRLVQHRAAGALLDVLPAAPSRYSTRFSIWQQGGRKCHSAERDARVDCGARRPAACARRRTPRGLRRIGGSFRSRLPQSCGTRRSPSTTSHDAHVQRSGNRKNTDDGLRCHVPTSWVVQFLPSPPVTSPLARLPLINEGFARRPNLVRQPSGSCTRVGVSDYCGDNTCAIQDTLRQPA